MRAKGIAKKLVVGLNFLLESQLQEELPERILAGCQLRYVDFSQANVPPEPQPVSLEPSINSEQEKDDEKWSMRDPHLDKNIHAISPM